MKKTGIIIIGAIVALAAIFGLFYVSAHNSIIALEEKINSSEAEIGVQLERRADLIPNLINSVKGYMKHEEGIISEITEAREKMVNASSLEDRNAADQQLTSALNNLYVIVENYPDLKASQNFTQLQDELSGTENRIATARKDYNDSVEQYNKKIKTIPTSIVAGMMHAEEKAYLQTSEEKTAVPTVEF